ncbi:MAG: MFS transporter [Rheinheimera sp.]|nr:MAG: MFS transporter [Rheinheimera sp.]
MPNRATTNRASTSQANTNRAASNHKVQRYLLAAGFLALFFANQSVLVLAVPFYQMTLALDPLLLSLAIAGPMLLGSSISGYVGRASDCCQSRLGRRRPFLLAGVLGLSLSFVLMWQVPADWPPLWQLGYFSLLSLLFFLALPLLAVPLSSLVFEQTPDPQQRTAVFGLASAVQKLGSLGYQWLVPLSQLALFSSFQQGVRWVGALTGTLLIALPGLLLAFRARETNHATNHDSNHKAAPATQAPVAARDSLSLLCQRPLLRWLMLLCLLQLCGCAFVATLDYYLLVYAMNQADLVAGSWWKALLSSGYALAGLAFVPVLGWSSARFGAVHTLCWVFMLNLLGGAAKWWLYQGDPTYWLLLDAILCSAAWTAMAMLIPPLLAATEPAGSTAFGAVSALHHWVVSVSAALSMLLSGLALNTLGFAAGAGAAQADGVLDAMRLLLSGGTVLCSLFALLVLWHVQRLQFLEEHR